jgi:hypothetical protein
MHLFLIFWPGVSPPLLKGSRARPEAAAQSPGASPGAAGTGEDGAQRTLDATALAKLAMVMWGALPRSTFDCRASPALLLILIWPLICAVDLALDLGF